LLKGDFVLGEFYLRAAVVFADALRLAGWGVKVTCGFAATTLYPSHLPKQL
jgi:hypothetical protein